MRGKLHGDARMSVARGVDANNLETRRRVLADSEQVFEDVGRGLLEPGRFESPEGGSRPR